MIHINKMNCQKQYDVLFPSEREKAAAFDAIAEQYYFGNFGRMQKTDFETLLFSLYLDRILDISEEELHTYSDYILSRQLGITQAKVSCLKVKKELQYPYEGFDWKKSFQRIVFNARYENGKIKINIPDRNLYLEVKNAIETEGGYIDVRLNTSVLQVSPKYFIDLMLRVSSESEREEIRANLKEKLSGTNEDTEYLERKTVGEILKGSAIEVAAGCIEDCIPVVGTGVAQGIRQAFLG